MKYMVVKEFTTPLRRFRMGAEIFDFEIDGPVPSQQYLDAGYIEPMMSTGEMEEPEMMAEDMEELPVEEVEVVDDPPMKTAKFHRKADKTP